MRLRQLVDEVKGATGPVDRLEEVVRRAIGSFGGMLGASDLRVLATDLDPSIIDLMRDDELAGELSAAALFARVERAAAVTPALALEVTEVTLGILGRSLSDDSLRLLRAHLPGDVADLLVAPDRRTVPNPEGRHHEAHDGGRRTLSSGRPGGTHPVSDGRPGHGQSLANSTDPHGPTKLSGAHGAVTGREGRTLADAGSGRAPPAEDGEHAGE